MPYFDKFDICQIHEESLMSEYMCECPLCRDIGIFGCLLKVGDLNKAGWFTLKSIANPAYTYGVCETCKDEMIADGRWE